MSHTTIADTGLVALGLERARLCPDCDLLTDAAVCPVCGRNATCAVAHWFPPLATSGVGSRDTDTPIWEL